MDLTNYLRKDYATPSIYYGYSSDANADSTDFNWSIRKVTTAANVETVTWSNGDPGKPFAKWNDRVSSFIGPTGSLGLTCSKGTQIGNSVPLSINWNQLLGANRYQIVVSSDNKKVLAQSTTDNIHMLPAHFESLKLKFPKSSIHIESASGEVIWKMK